MCLILFSYNENPDYRLVLASNRDEFYDRPSSGLAFWQAQGGILAGRDIRGGGTWIGVSSEGRFAGITNYRNPSGQNPEARSRGILVSSYLDGSDGPLDFLKKISGEAGEYNGFNFIAGDRKSLYYFSNIEGRIRKIESGIYGLSNHLLDTPWPKVTRGKERLRQIIRNRHFETESLFEMLADDECPRDEFLPETGVGIKWERILGSLFIKSDIYGTRCSTIITIDSGYNIQVTERSFSPDGSGMITGEITHRIVSRRP